MSTDFRALCQELLIDYEQHLYRSVLADRARAALAAEAVVEGPTDEEVEVWADQQGFVRGHADHPCGFWIDDGDVGALVRAALARYGHQPAPPVEGEVGELVAWLRNMANAGLGGLDELNAARAADLLEQRHPTPVPVSERLPGPEDCNEMGQCWWFDGDVWSLDIYDHEYTYWLSASALLLPTTAYNTESND